MSTNENLRTSIATGTLLSVCIGVSDIGKSILLAAVGAAVSFTVSLLLRFVARKLKEWLG